MTELIKIETKDGIETVKARDLHGFLNVSERYSRWWDRMIGYGFDEGSDYTPYQMVHPQNGQEVTEHFMTFDMAKELSMLARSEKGKEARQYFIAVEKRAKEISKPQLTDDEIVYNAILIQQNKIKLLESKIEEDKDKVQFFNDVTGSKDAVEMGKVAKLLDCGMGRNKLFEFLRNNGVLRQNNEPYQKYIDARWFRVIEQKFEKSPGEFSVNIKTLVYQKGVAGISSLIEKSKGMVK